MLIGSVVEDEIEDDAETARVRAVEEALEIVERPVLRRDARVVGHVVPAIELRRGVVRRKPEGVNAEVIQVIQPRHDAREVADAIPIPVRKTARVDLIKDGGLSPLEVSHAVLLGEGWRLDVGSWRSADVRGRPPTSSL